MKNRQSGKTSLSSRQRFFVPGTFPFLEIRTTLDSALPYAEHFHSAFSLGLILAGKTCFSLEGKKHTAEQGDIVLITPGQAHSCNPIDDAPRSYHMAFIDEVWFREHMGIALEMRSGIRVCKRVITDPALFAKAAVLIEELDFTGRDASGVLTNLLFELHERHECFAPPAGKWEFAPPNMINSGLSWLDEEREGHPSSVSRLAESAGVRRESFSRAVRRKTGLPPSRYLHCEA